MHRRMQGAFRAASLPKDPKWPVWPPKRSIGVIFFTDLDDFLPIWVLLQVTGVEGKVGRYIPIRYFRYIQNCKNFLL